MLRNTTDMDPPDDAALDTAKHLPATDFRRGESWIKYSALTRDPRNYFGMKRTQP